MLTKQDLNAIGSLIDKKVGDDIAAIQARMADFETGKITKSDLFRLEHYLIRLEKRVTSVEGRLLNTSTKDDIKNLKNSLKSLERRLIIKINESIDSLDSNIVDVQKRTDRIEKHLDLPPIAVI
ncbi:MAG: hypothetical protein UR63_C0027G0018 [Candidatus Roizmanbacteria bacterium GW2011_GWC2_35_12]|uniref:Uncharacterized protein n=1 Tax=Candidatus Roizmanbacteria bacterium GW2011_GWC2_35_12 TaxID=1618485 RepID=A0A0G0BBQ7_9BACT|nr:MAG: hypothetical protein UR63_C0027G0018 [Candidatus Roizmanbacteria bacterium GW2011_GWC2_35_12]